MLGNTKGKVGILKNFGNRRDNYIVGDVFQGLFFRTNADHDHLLWSTLNPDNDAVWLKKNCCTVSGIKIFFTTSVNDYKIMYMWMTLSYCIWC